MSLTSKTFLKLVTQARQLITQEFNIETIASVECGTEKEIMDIIVRDAQERNLSNATILSMLRKIPFLYGIYFKHSSSAYVIFGKGNNLPIITHELLHSIQVCNPHRDDILDYISYKLTDDVRFIDPVLKREWGDRERIYTWKRIKARILRDGDCDDFDNE